MYTHESSGAISNSGFPISSFKHAYLMCFYNLHEVRHWDQIVYLAHSQHVIHVCTKLWHVCCTVVCTTHEGTGTLTPRPMSPYCCSEPTLQNYKESSCKRKTAVRYAYLRDRCKRDSHANFEHRDNAAAFTANWGWVSWWRICPCVGWCGTVLASQRQVSFGSCRDFWALTFDARRQSLRLFGQGQMELMGGVCD